MTETAEKKQKRLFQKGESGNPAGRPPGCRNKSTMAAQALLDGQADAITQRAIELALQGDPVALKLCLQRIVAPRRDMPVRIRLPSIRSAADLPAALASITKGMASGEITPGEAETICKVFEAFGKAYELSDMQKRMEEIEKQIEKQKRDTNNRNY